MTLSHAPIHAASSWIEPRLETHPAYVCPDCRVPLGIAEDTLVCPACGHDFGIFDGIPDFVRHSPVPQLPMFTRLVLPLLDLVAGIYETPFWYDQVLSHVGGPGAPDFNGLTGIMARKMRFPAGPILDVACGPATWGRRVARADRDVYGIDLALPMLRKGMDYIRSGHIPKVHLARGRVERLPFPDAMFEGAICGGALHLFPDTIRALKEIGRTMKDGARLVCTTFTSGSSGLLTFRWLRGDRGLRVFELGELAEDLSCAGFKHFDPVVHGSVLVFTAQRVVR